MALVSCVQMSLYQGKTSDSILNDNDDNDHSSNSDHLLCTYYVVGTVLITLHDHILTAIL